MEIDDALTDVYEALAETADALGHRISTLTARVEQLEQSGLFPEDSPPVVDQWTVEDGHAKLVEPMRPPLPRHQSRLEPCEYCKLVQPMTYRNPTLGIKRICAVCIRQHFPEMLNDQLHEVL